MFAAVLLLVGVISFLSPSVCNGVELTGCQADSYCAGAGDTIMYNCGMNTSDIQIVILDNSKNPAFEAWFNESSEIGDSQNETIGSVTVYYNKTSSTNIRVWFMADASLDGYKFECRDAADNVTDVHSCSINVNSALATPSSFGLQSNMYCEATNFTWGTTGNTTCLKEFVLRRTNSTDGTSTDITLGADVRSYTGIDVAFAGNDEFCVSIASRNYMKTSGYTNPQCVQFTVPRSPMGLMKDFNVDSANDDGEVEVTITWNEPGPERPNVTAYYITTNISDSNGDDDGSGPNMDEDNFKTIKILGDRTMMKLQGAMEGYYYSVKLVAENCFGNSTDSSIAFKLEHPQPTPTTTTTATGTATESVSPSASPDFDDDEGLSETLIIVIAVIAVVVFLLIVFLPLIICCCCVCFCGVSIACCACADSSDNDFEMRDGTRL